MGSSPPEGFEEFVRASARPLLRAAWLLTGDHHAAQDLVQETHLRVAERWEKVSGGGDPMPYARTVLYRLHVDQWRWRRRRPETVVEAIPEPHGRDATEAAALRLVLRSALATLTPRQRAVLVLRFLEDRTEASTAEILGCSVNTVKSQTRHALERLRILNPHLFDELAPEMTR